MTKTARFLFTLLLTLLLMSVAGCSGAPSTPATATEEPVEEENAPDPEPASVVEEATEPNYCLDCHTDKDQLIATAEEEEEVISENEGEG